MAVEREQTLEVGDRRRRDAGSRCEEDAVERAGAGVVAEVDQVVDQPHRLAELGPAVARAAAPPARVAMISNGSTDVSREDSSSVVRGPRPPRRRRSAAPPRAPHRAGRRRRAGAEPPVARIREVERLEERLDHVGRERDRAVGGERGRNDARSQPRVRGAAAAPARSCPGRARGATRRPRGRRRRGRRRGRCPC